MRSRLTARLAPRIVGWAALLPLLAMAFAGQGYDRFRCAFTGEVSEVGCCAGQEAPAGPAANAASCCDHESARPVRVAAEPPSPRLAASLLPAPVSAVSAPPVQPAAAALAPRPGAQAPRSPPLLLVKQSFLI
ncbi:MAG TPA: hypothetical protein VMT47_08855 [Polyangia bacterium]|nr:hypothetical protein [Polyangia bacterium]